jgi:glutamyl-tRNA reductase
MASAPICLLGLSHRTAPVDIRECYAFDEEGALAVVSGLVGSDIREAVLLSTCNRTEIYGVGSDGDGPEKVQAAMLESLARAKDRSVSELEPHIYRMDGTEAVRHLFRVAGSLDSLVLGEPQILGQVKTAYRIGTTAGTVGPVLSRFFERAFKVAKEIRTSTGVGTGQVSVGSIAVDLSRKVFGDLSRCSVLLLGAGKMAEAVARTLSSAGAGRVLVANRTVDKALKVAERYGWKGSALDDLPSLLIDADVVIASVAYPGHLIDRASLKGVMGRRRFKSMFLVDIAVPRVIDPASTDLEGVYLYNIDDFNRIIADHLKRRSQDVRQAEAIIAREVEGAERWLRTQAVQPLVAELCRRTGEIREREVARALRELGDLTDEQQKVIQVMASSLANKLMSDPLTTLRESVNGHEGDVLAAAVRRLFRLEANGAGHGPEQDENGGGDT